MTNLPFPYFSQGDLKKVLLPSLIAVCHDNEENKTILLRDMSYDLLRTFAESQDGKDNHLVQLVMKDNSNKK